MRKPFVVCVGYDTVYANNPGEKQDDIIIFVLYRTHSKQKGGRPKQVGLPQFVPTLRFSYYVLHDVSLRRVGHVL
jgi:hypothetical protein